MEWYDFIPGVAAGRAAFGKGPFSGLFGGNQPNYSDLAQQQANLQNQFLDKQTQANRPNQTTPFGSSTWSKDANGNWTQTQSLSPELQQKYNTLMNAWGTQLGKGPLDVAGYQKQAQDALYAKQAATLDPQMRQEQSSLNSQLANQGLDPGSAAARMQQDQLARQRTGAYSDARMNSILGSGQEASRLFGMDMAARQEPLQEMGALFGLGKMPGFTPAGMGQAPDILGATAMQQKGQADQMNGLFQMGASILPFLL